MPVKLKVYTKDYDALLFWSISALMKAITS
jgi:hypothetical protein